MEKNIYDIDLTDLGLVEKKRYMPKEKAERTVAIYQRIDGVINTLKANIANLIESEIQLAQESNTKEVVKATNKLAEKLAKILDVE